MPTLYSPLDRYRASLEPDGDRLVGPLVAKPGPHFSQRYPFDEPGVLNERNLVIAQLARTSLR